MGPNIVVKHATRIRIVIADLGESGLKRVGGDARNTETCIYPNKRRHNITLYQRLDCSGINGLGDTMVEATRESGNGGLWQYDGGRIGVKWTYHRGKIDKICQYRHEH